MKRYLLMLLALILCVGCTQLNKEVDNRPDNEPDDSVDTETILEVEGSEFEVDYKAQSVEIRVVCNREFEVDVCVDWISYTIAESGDKVVLKLLENSDTEPRSAEVVILAGDQICSVNIQQGVKPELMELLLEHSSAHLDSPEWSGYDIKGSVDWGDGTSEEYSEGVSHDYSDAQKRSAQFQMEGATSFRIEQIGDIECVTISI